MYKEQGWVQYMLWWSKSTKKFMLSFKGNVYPHFVKRTNSDNQQQFFFVLKTGITLAAHTQKHISTEAS